MEELASSFGIGRGLTSLNRKKLKLGFVGIQVRFGKNVAGPADCSMEMGMRHHLGTGFSVYERIISVIQRIAFY
jgi:hypothetical protein